jgi:histidinol dehydrogenase
MLTTIRMTDPRAPVVLERWLEQHRDSDVLDAVRPILAAVRRDGDAALIELTSQLDRVTLTADRLRVAPAELAAATIDSATYDALQRTAARIEAFHLHERRPSWWTVSPDGALLGQRIVPIDSVGIYVPGGEAPYASSLLMNAVPARIAGVPRIVVATPPGDGGTIHPAILAATRICGIDEVYRLGGAQAIAALAYGTGTVPRVAKIVGPGNAYVATAKRLVFGDVGIDTIAGPSEVAILADRSADPRFVAADLIAQAEHDRDAVVVLITSDVELVREVNAELRATVSALARAETIRTALESGLAIVTRSLDEAFDVIERLAPEHLELLVDDPLAVLPRVRSAGVILCGPLAPAPICDYGIGPNHVLPTGGAARFASALGVDDFVRRVSIVRPTRAAFDAVARDAILLAGAEGLTAHAAALRMREEGSDEA